MVGDHQKNKGPNRIGEKRFGGMTFSERIMAVLTLLGLVIAVLTGVIFWRQLKWMQADQRAWISVTTPKTQLGKNEASGAVHVLAPVKIINTGKTPAKNVSVQIVVEKVKNGELPQFVYGDSGLKDFTGTMFPNDSHEITVGLLQDKPNQTPEDFRLLTPSEYQELLDGVAYTVTYGKASYTDVFGTDHWLTFCVWMSPATKSLWISAKSCADYNNVDSN
jgi:hypothetical protein